MFISKFTIYHQDFYLFNYIFLKENIIHKIYVSYPPKYRIVSQNNGFESVKFVKIKS
jgi:hypothetical protein